jgi:NADH-quinone oxidoreductase subunit J
MMSRYVIAFEVAGLLLTAALVGAIALAHREDDTTGPEQAERPSKSESSRTAASSLTTASR